jgi:hypothetical protein
LAYKLLADERETIEQSIKQARENVEILKRLQPETYERLFIEAEVSAYD